MDAWKILARSANLSDRPHKQKTIPEDRTELGIISLARQKGFPAGKLISLYRSAKMSPRYLKLRFRDRNEVIDMIEGLWVRGMIMDSTRMDLVLGSDGKFYAFGLSTYRRNPFNEFGMVVKPVTPKRLGTETVIFPKDLSAWYDKGYVNRIMELNPPTWAGQIMLDEGENKAALGNASPVDLLISRVSAHIGVVSSDLFEQEKLSKAVIMGRNPLEVKLATFMTRPLTFPRYRNFVAFAVEQYLKSLGDKLLDTDQAPPNGEIWQVTLSDVLTRYFVMVNLEGGENGW